MNRVQRIQQRVGTTPDGSWGPMSRAAAIRHFKSLMPRSNPWPGKSQSQLQAFYGSPGNVPMTRIDVTGLGVQYAGTTVNSISCHTKVAQSLLRVLRNISNSPFRYVLAGYAGVYNNRPMRGGSLPSLHARAAAIDLRPGTNGLHTPWPVSADMPIEVMEMFAQEGWTGLGWQIGRDAMHFEAVNW
jgi:hypothetical protein